jgi:hypothetical protein
VEVLFDGKGSMYLLTGWKKLARDHDVEIGCLLNFFYKSDNEMSIRCMTKGLANPLPHRLGRRHRR